MPTPMSRVRAAALGLTLFAAFLLAPAAGALAFQAELQRYYRALDQICRSGVTPEVTQVYEEARRAVDAAKYGGGRDNNVWSVKAPEPAYTECFRSPGEGKT
jgi:hypothetical protein